MGNLRVATYCRISDDREGQALGVQRQAEDCNALAKARGWTISGRFVDNDVSAYSGKPRPVTLNGLARRLFPRQRREAHHAGP